MSLRSHCDCEWKQMWNFLNVKERTFGLRNQNRVSSQWMSLLWMVAVYSCSCVSCAPSRWLIKASVSTSSSSRGYTPLRRGEQEETQYLQPSVSRFRGSCEWASRRAFGETQTVSLCEDFLTSTLCVLRLGHSPQERTIANEISLKSRLFLLDSAPVIWRAYGERCLSP